MQRELNWVNDYNVLIELSSENGQEIFNATYDDHPIQTKARMYGCVIAIYHGVTERALEDGSIDSYFTGIIGDEVIYVGTFNEKEKDANTLYRGLSWLGKYDHMLQKYPGSEEYAQIEQGAVCHEGGS